MLVLGIETSCDETGIAIYDTNKGILAHALHSQIALHQQYGGVVPELASRDHSRYLVPLLKAALAEANLDMVNLEAIAYTAGPGLVGALLTGASFAKSLAFSLNIPAFAVHHLEAHILAAKLESPELDFPFLVLLVSGGHTQLIIAHDLGNYQIIGDSLDDAVGEAFDKTAKLMGIPYPGGAKLAYIADNFQTSKVSSIPPFPRPMANKPGLDFSFSGLKTHAATTWQKSLKDESSLAAIAHAFQEAVVETLVIKCRRALAETKINRLVVSGGVGANQKLRLILRNLMENEGGKIYFPRLEYCTDNGAMVAYAGALHLLQKKQDKSLAILVKARWPLNEPL